ncbi:tubulin-specific chaperone A-like isoform X2 [Calliopsis andreniformis]|uniref:tubulin-specific chaperone A-like isoform X2 n=1 Tax=Calliopsis andreniformis TaxID=337506 RepID=UPI003FCC6436
MSERIFSAAGKISSCIVIVPLSFRYLSRRINDKDGYDIKKQEEVLQESLMMVPDCQRRLIKAFEELKKILDTEQDLKELEDYIEAEKVLQEAENQLPKEGELLEMC